MSEELAYIAGFVDGEGCLTINGRHDGVYRPLFRVFNNDKEVLRWIQKTLGAG